VILGFHRDVDEACALRGYYAASNDGPLPTFRDNVPGPIFKDQDFHGEIDFLTLEHGIDMLSRNVGRGLPLDAALYSRGEQISRWNVFTARYEMKLQIKCRLNSAFKRQAAFTWVTGSYGSV
jgi:hypothetical protein